MVNEGFKYIGVSKVACKDFEEKTGHKCELIYNIVPIKPKGIEKKKGLNLISATRLTSEKGGERINKLAKMLDKRGIKYTWTIYTNKIRYRFNSPNIIVKPQKLDLTKEIEESSFLVQLSDCESFGLSVCESLILGTPVIITDLEAFKEIGCINGKNAIICDLSMNNVDIDKIVEGLPKTSYTPLKSCWNKYLSTDSDYNPKDKVKCITKKGIYDIELNKHYIRNTIIELSKERASYMESLNYVEVL